VHEISSFHSKSGRISTIRLVISKSLSSSKRVQVNWSDTGCWSMLFWSSWEGVKGGSSRVSAGEVSLKRSTETTTYNSSKSFHQPQTRGTHSPVLPQDREGSSRPVHYIPNPRIALFRERGLRRKLRSVDLSIGRSWIERECVSLLLSLESNQQNSVVGDARPLLTHNMIELAIRDSSIRSNRT